MKDADATTSRLRGGLPTARWRVPGRVVDLLLAAVLAFATLKVNCRLDRHVELDGTDESEYLAIGLAIPRAGLPDPREEVFFAPLYSLWYLGLAQFWGEPSGLVDVNFRLLSAALACAFFAIARRAGCRVLPAALGALLLLVHRLSLDPPTRSIHFAALMLAWGIWGALCVKGTERQAAVLGLSAAAAALVRPEYAFLALAAFSFALAAALRERPRSPRSEWLFLGGAGLAAAGLVAALGAPIGAGNNRSWVAFAQHFSLRHLAAHPSGLDPWWDSYEVMAQFFGTSGSVGQAMRANPGAFFGHMLGNLGDLATRLPQIALAHRNFLLPDGRRMEFLEQVALAALLLTVVLARSRRARDNARAVWAQHPAIVLFAASIAGIAIAGMLLTSVADRYFYPLLFLALLALSIALGKRPATQGRSQPAWPPSHLALLALGLLGLAPAPSYVEQSPTPFRTALAALKEWRFEESTGFLEALATRSVEIYLDPQLRLVHPTEKRTGFRAFLAQHRIGVVHLTPYLRNTRTFIDDPEWQEFLRVPASFGFAVHSLPFSEALYVREAVIARRDAPP